jgi:AcrR family transcriptional regulator
MARSPEPTRTKLIQAGERLFAEHGIDNVSLREITRAAGARNVVALQHHFADREGLLHAIIDKHHIRVEERRHALLDACETNDTLDSRSLAAALVRPLAACLEDTDGGPEFLQIFADVVNRPRPIRWPSPIEGREDSMERWRTLVAPLLPPGAQRLHRRFAAVLYVSVELARCARDERPHDHPLIASAAIDLVASNLTTPMSDETARLLRDHDKDRSTRA